MNQKLIKSFLLGSLSLATLVPTGVAGWKVFAAKGESKVSVEVPEVPKATTAPSTSPKAEEIKEQAVLGISTSVETASPTVSPSSSSFPVASSIGVGASLGDDDRVEVEGVETHVQSNTSINQSIHLED